MTGKKIPLGQTGEHTRKRIADIRGDKRMSYAELSRILGGLGRPIPPLGLRRMEAGERRIDVDDLVALAVALGVSPIGLLMPDTDGPATPVAVVDTAEPVPAEQVWDWLCALEPLPTRPEHGWIGLREASWPSWKWEQFAKGIEWV